MAGIVSRSIFLLSLIFSTVAWGEQNDESFLRDFEESSATRLMDRISDAKFVGDFGPEYLWFQVYYTDSDGELSRQDYMSTKFSVGCVENCEAGYRGISAILDHGSNCIMTQFDNFVAALNFEGEMGSRLEDSALRRASVYGVVLQPRLNDIIIKMGVNESGQPVGTIQVEDSVGDDIFLGGMGSDRMIDLCEDPSALANELIQKYSYSESDLQRDRLEDLAKKKRKIKYRSREIRNKFLLSEVLSGNETSKMVP